MARPTGWSTYRCQLASQVKRRNGVTYADLVAKSTHDADLQLVRDLAKVLHLLVKRHIVVPLLGDAGVLALLDLGLLEWLRHLVGGCGRKRFCVAGCL